MAKSPRTSALSIQAHYPLFARAGTEAAALWLQAAPLSLSDFRDLRLRNLLAGLGYMDDLHERTQAFHHAYEQRIAAHIAGVSHG